MISTPICDFVRSYAAADPVRLHMPGHKGSGPLGCEWMDITEIRGADDLYHADGIIAESEANASRLFGCSTFYSTEGSSLCIRAMLYLAVTDGSDRPLILAGRNAHKSFLYAAAALDFDIGWLRPAARSSYHSCPVTAADVENAILRAPRKPRAVYLTSPDYLGGVSDIPAVARVCHENGVLLLVDNAHGAYLRFLPQSRHPMDLGADLCCDSAHKTLPVLTGGAYLHIAERVSRFCGRAKDALALFGSTSPSYLILQSLDIANPYLEKLPEKLAAFLPAVRSLKEQLRAEGWQLVGNEELKITLDAAARGYTGDEIAALLEQRGIIPEFSDPDYLVLMLTPENTAGDLMRVKHALSAAAPRTPLPKPDSEPLCPPVLLTPRQAMLLPREHLPLQESQGRILAAANVGCPPAIPIVMCGEQITQEAITMMARYGITHCSVIRNVDEQN